MGRRIASDVSPLHGMTRPEHQLAFVWVAGAHLGHQSVEMRSAAGIDQHQLTVGGYLQPRDGGVAHVESPGDGAAAALAGGQALEGLSLLMVTELGRPFADARKSSGHLNPSNAAFELTPWQVRPSLAAMVRSERPGSP